MSDSTKFEYIKMLDEFEVLTKQFDELQEITAKLKEEYRKDPENQELLDYIKKHEEKYKEVYEKFENLNARSKQLLDISNAENGEK